MRAAGMAVVLAAAVSVGPPLAAEAVPVGAGERPDGGSTQPNPTVVFTSPGPKNVTLTVCNPAGFSSVTKTVLVLDPRPAIGSSAATPARLEQGQRVLLDAVGTGAPPLSYSWQLLHNGVVLATLFGAHAVWPTSMRRKTAASSGSSRRSIRPCRRTSPWWSTTSRRREIRCGSWSRRLVSRARGRRRLRSR